MVDQQILYYKIANRISYRKNPAIFRKTNIDEKR